MDTFLITIPAFLFALGVIVFVHEFGHFAVAKAFGIRVLTFSLGFGKRLWGFNFRGTDCRISAVPLGGYVQMWGELPEDRTGAPSEFTSKPRWQRILVYLAGPAMNLVLSVALFTYVFMDGIPQQALQEIPAVVGMVEDGRPGDQAGLRPDDRIVAVNGTPIERWNELEFELTISPEKPVQVAYEREGVRYDTVVTPEKNERYEFGDAGLYPAFQPRVLEVLSDTPAAAAGFRPGDVLHRVDDEVVGTPSEFVDYIEARPETSVAVTVRRGESHEVLTVVPANIEGKGRIGVQVVIYRQLPFGEAIAASVAYNVEIIQKSTQLLGKLFTREIAAKSALSGPIEIAAWSGRAAREGWKQLLFTMGFLSISIGFMNLLPIPVLDGGHITILLIESAMRRDMSVLIKERITQLGFMMLMMLMAVVIFFDLSKNLPALMPGS